MKMMKKLLAVALAGVLALTVLVGCSGTVSAENIPPEDVREAYNALIDGAADLGLMPKGTVKYSTKYEEYAKMLGQGSYNSTSGTFDVGWEGSKAQQEILSKFQKEFPNAKILLEFIPNDSNPSAPQNPVVNASMQVNGKWSFDAIYAKKDAWMDADAISMAAFGGSSGKAYIMVILVDENVK